MTRLVDICRGLGALATLAFLLVGAPIALYVVSGSPIPDRLPDWEEIRVTLMQPDHDHSVFLGVIRLIGWGGWVLFVILIGTETIGLLTGGSLKLPTSVRPAQHVARDLITMTALIFTTGAALTHTVEPHTAHAAVATADAEQKAPPYSVN
uniref:hypothetical protein n=1 Tax=Actinomadura sp. SCN-SB TaxID=3373092 RepID=UPI0037523B41